MTTATETPRHVIHLARTGERLEVEAPTVHDALRQVGRPDACELSARVDLLGDGTAEIDAIFGPDAPVMVTIRAPEEATHAEMKARALAVVVNYLEGETAGRRGGELPGGRDRWSPYRGGGPVSDTRRTLEPRLALVSDAARQAPADPDPRPVRRVPILLALPEGEEGDSLSAAFDALTAAGVEHEPLPPGGLDDAQRRTLSRRLAAALECLEVGHAEGAAGLLRETLASLAPAAPEEPTP